MRGWSHTCMQTNLLLQCIHTKQHVWQHGNMWYPNQVWIVAWHTLILCFFVKFLSLVMFPSVAINQRFCSQISVLAANQISAAWYHLITYPAITGIVLCLLLIHTEYRSSLCSVLVWAILSVNHSSLHALDQGKVIVLPQYNPSLLSPFRVLLILLLSIQAR